MNIEGLGESLVDQLIEQGLVKDFGDLYALEASQLENLVVVPREPRSERAVPRKLGKVGRNVIEQIERSKQNDLSRLVYALGIRHVGEKVAGTLARYLQDHGRDPRCAARGAADRSRDRAGRGGLGPQRSPTSRTTGRSIEKLAAAGVNMASQQPEPSVVGPGPLAGKTFVLTGTLQTMTREQASSGDRAAWRQGVRVGQQEDDRPGGRGRRRQQARQGEIARRSAPD